MDESSFSCEGILCPPHTILHYYYTSFQPSEIMFPFTLVLFPASLLTSPVFILLLFCHQNGRKRDVKMMWRCPSVLFADSSYCLMLLSIVSSSISNNIILWGGEWWPENRRGWCTQTTFSWESGWDGKSEMKMVVSSPPSPSGCAKMPDGQKRRVAQVNHSWLDSNSTLADSIYTGCDVDDVCWSSWTSFVSTLLPYFMSIHTNDLF